MSARIGLVSKRNVRRAGAASLYQHARIFPPRGSAQKGDMDRMNANARGRALAALAALAALPLAVGCAAVADSSGEVSDVLGPSDPSRVAFVQLFEWKWTDIARECESCLGPK